MRRRDHERIIHNLERQITWLQRQNETLLNRLMYSEGKPWELPPIQDEEPDNVIPFDPERYLTSMDTVPEE